MCKRDTSAPMCNVIHQLITIKVNLNFSVEKKSCKVFYLHHIAEGLSKDLFISE